MLYDESSKLQKLVGKDISTNVQEFPRTYHSSIYRIKITHKPHRVQIKYCKFQRFPSYVIYSVIYSVT